MITLIFSSSCSLPDFVEQKRLLLGTEVSIKIFSVSSTDPRLNGIFLEAFDEIKRIENIASFFSPSSELFYLNSKASYEPVQVNEELFYLVEKGLWMSELSDGAFDVTATSLGQIGGYKTIKLDRAKKEIYFTPLEKAADINPVGERKSYKGVKEQSSLTGFTDKNCKVDMGAYGKGYAVDRALEVLKRHSVEEAVVDAGGNIKFLGVSSNRKEWLVGIRNPDDPAKIFNTLKVKPCVSKTEIRKEAAVATSGNYLRKHIVALKERDEGVLSVTIIAPTALEADLLSTTLFNMADSGERLKVLENFDNVEVWIIRRDGNGRLELVKE